MYAVNVHRTACNVVASALSIPVHCYIAAHRNRLLHNCTALSIADKAQLLAYFGQTHLDGIRVVIADPLPIRDPPFTGLIRRFGFDFPEVALTAAITFDNVIACREQMDISLLFHELVHTVQYRLLGISEFASQYVRGFLFSRVYCEIPLERCAFYLQQRFETVSSPFSVETEVLAWLKQRHL